MALETGTYISDLVDTNPTGSDALAFADDHLRLIKSTVKATFPNISGAVTKTHTEINAMASQTDLTTLDTALKAYVDAAVLAARQNAYPVGSIYVNATNATNPATLLGFGTWVEFGAGRVMVGQNASDPLFDTLEETGGSKDAIVVSHSHTASTNTASLTGTLSNFEEPFGSASGIVSLGNVGQSYYGGSSLPNGNRTATINASHSHSVTVDSAGSSGTNANIQPYITVKMWKRTA